jgi:hypothetical protein
MDVHRSDVADEVDEQRREDDHRDDRDHPAGPMDEVMADERDEHQRHVEDDDPERLGDRQP